MEKPAVLPMRDCWICFNNENCVTLTKLNGEKLLKNCTTYLDTSIIINSIQNDTYVSYCSDCFESARQFTNLEEQVKKLQKEISDVSLVFSKNVLQRRKRAHNKMDNAKNSVLPAEKCFKNSDYWDRHSIEMIDNVTGKEEVIEAASKELPADSHWNINSDDNNIIASDPWFETIRYPFLSENVMDIKYSCDETVSLAVNCADGDFGTNQGVSETNAEEIDKEKMMSMTDLLKCVTMPTLRLERLQPCSNSPKIVAAAGNIELTGDNILDRNKPYKCSICELGYLNMLDLQDHVKSHGTELPYVCSICEKSFARPSLLKIHERAHTKDRPFTCSICSKSFIRAAHLRRHEISHKEALRCAFCSKSFQLPCSLKRHERSHTEEKLHKCSFCSQSFLLESQLNQHAKIHAEERPYKCLFCEKSFVTAYDLKTHERVHTGEKPFSCCLCSKSFAGSNQLKRHQIIHSEDTPYKCSLCSKSFKSSDSLRKHQQTHSEKKYQCTLCEKSFAKIGNLQYHERVHSGERPFQCSFCPKSFIQSADVKRHEMIHTGEKPHKCSNCESTFKQKSDLKYHYYRKHRNEEKSEEFILP